MLLQECYQSINKWFNHWLVDSISNHGASHNGQVYPAFLDKTTGRVYLACDSDGNLSPIHGLLGKPCDSNDNKNDNESLVKVTESIEQVIVGYIKDGQFFEHV